MAEEKRRPGRPKSEGPTKERKISLRMEQAQYDRLKEFSKEHGLTVGNTVNKAIDYYIESQK